MAKLRDLTDQRFGRLTVIERAANHVYTTHYPYGETKTFTQTVWHCRCDCGKEKDIEGNSLRRGVTKSCGCLAKEKSGARLRAKWAERKRND